MKRREREGGKGHAWPGYLCYALWNLCDDLRSLTDPPSLPASEKPPTGKRRGCGRASTRPNASGATRAGHVKRRKKKPARAMGAASGNLAETALCRAAQIVRNPLRSGGKSREKGQWGGRVKESVGTKSTSERTPFFCSKVPHCANGKGRKGGGRCQRCGCQLSTPWTVIASSHPVLQITPSGNNLHE